MKQLFTTAMMMPMCMRSMCMFFAYAKFGSLCFIKIPDWQHGCRDRG